MAIDYCHKHDFEWDRDKFTACPRCKPFRSLASLDAADRARNLGVRIEIAEKGANDLIRKLMERYPFDATKASNDLHGECKRVLGEA